MLLDENDSLFSELNKSGDHEPVTMEKFNPHFLISFLMNFPSHFLFRHSCPSTFDPGEACVPKIPPKLFRQLILRFRPISGVNLPPTDS